MGREFGFGTKSHRVRGPDDVPYDSTKFWSTFYDHANNAGSRGMKGAKAAQKPADPTKDVRYLYNHSNGLIYSDQIKSRSRRRIC